MSLGTNVIAHREQFHQSRLVEAAIPSSATYNDALQRATHYFVEHGGSLIQARQQAFAWIGAQVQAQASLLAYRDLFVYCGIAAFCVIPLTFLFSPSKAGGGKPSGGGRGGSRRATSRE